MLLRILPGCECALSLNYCWLADCSSTCRYGTHMADSVSVFYASAFHGKKLLAVGGKVAMLHYALHGSHVTFVDTAPSQLEVIRRVAVAKGVESYTDFIWVESVLDLDAKLSGLVLFDAVILLGSLDHIPHKLIQPAMHVLAGYLKPGGSWLQRSYPFKWWAQVQMTTNKDYPWLKFQACSQHTSREPPATLFPSGSGCSTSWAEWYDKGKLIKALQPYDFSVKWCGTQSEFIWFELIKNDKKGELECSVWIQFIARSPPSFWLEFYLRLNITGSPP